MAIFNEKGYYGIRMCLRGRHEEYMRARPTRFQGLPQPHEAETRGLKEVIKWFGSIKRYCTFLFPSLSKKSALVLSL